MVEPVLYVGITVAHSLLHALLFVAGGGMDPDYDGVPTTEENDADKDGFPDSPLPDADKDGVPDYLEPNNGDTDGDGTPNQTDADDDGDGIPTKEENDADKDGVPDDPGRRRYPGLWTATTTTTVR